MHSIQAQASYFHPQSQLQQARKGVCAGYVKFYSPIYNIGPYCQYNSCYTCFGNVNRQIVSHICLKKDSDLI